MFTRSLAASLALTVGLTASFAEAQPSPSTARAQCFLSRDWSSWRPSPDSKAIYLRVGVSQVFRLDLAYACPTLQQSNARLITKLRGSSWICHPLDIDLQVSDGFIPSPCMVKGLRRLTPAEVDALPKGSRP